MSAAKLEFHPVTARRWRDLETLFGERGACGGCWCMAWRLTNKAWAAGKGAANRAALKRIVDSGAEPGILAYREGEPVGWCAVAPREEYSYLERSRVLAPVDQRPVWSVSCLFVLKPHRRQGLSARLLEAAAGFAFARGAEVVEGYPVEPATETMPDPFVWTGTAAAFERAGFREVARRSKKRPIMRREAPAGSRAARR